MLMGLSKLLMAMVEVVWLSVITMEISCMGLAVFSPGC
jgi:hypothetical protein